jgi:transcriptional regulator of acetoin/glycerol metabolism
VRGANSGPHAGLVHSVVGHSMAGLPTGARSAPTVDISWRRCLNDFKLDPTQEYQPHVLDQSRLKDLQCEFEELVQIARAENR